MVDEVTTTDYDWKELVEQHEDLEEEDECYTFSNGRAFKRPKDGGVYEDE